MHFLHSSKSLTVPSNYQHTKPLEAELAMQELRRGSVLTTGQKQQTLPDWE